MLLFQFSVIKCQGPLILLWGPEISSYATGSAIPTVCVRYGFEVLSTLKV